MAKKAITKLSELTPDANNYNKGTEFGGGLIEKSLRKLGAGRSILLDKNGKVIAGNKTLENAVNAGFGDEDLIVVQTTGKQIVAVQRMDLDLNSKMGKEMALADNATAKANIEWDVEALASDWNSDELDGWGVQAVWDVGLSPEAMENFFDKDPVIGADGKMKIILEYVEDDFLVVKDALLKVAKTPEQAIWQLLGLKK